MVEGVLMLLKKSKQDNFLKTQLSQLVLSLFHPTAERLHETNAECGCGAARAAGGVHVFWDCVGAGGAVVEALAGELTGEWALPEGGALQREHLWLARRLTCAMHAGVWELVCKAAVTGMRAGSNWMTSHQDVLGGGRVAVQKMWEALADAACAGAMPV